MRINSQTQASHLESGFSDSLSQQQLNIAAMVFGDNERPDETLRRFLARIEAQGVQTAGLIQHGHCDAKSDRHLFVRLLHNKMDMQLLQDLGAHSQGCKLDVSQLLHAGMLISTAMDESHIELLIINRFGKQEQQGKGLLFLVAKATLQKIPVLIAIPKKNFADWCEFSGDMSVKLNCDERTIMLWWKAVAAKSNLKGPLQSPWLGWNDARDVVSA